MTTQVLKRPLLTSVAGFCVLTTAHPIAAAILDGPYVNPANGHEYYQLSTQTWHSAQAEAESLGGALAVLNDQAEIDWILATFTTYGASDSWFGYTDEAEEGTWVWITGEPVTFTNWGGGEPNNEGEEDCAQLSGSQWNDAQCASEVTAIVELADCNENEVPDLHDIQGETSEDCDSDVVPDECEPDTDSDGTIDDCDECPTDPEKTLRGECDCFAEETDSDSDGTPDCNDLPRYLHYQGRLRTSAGAPVGGTVELRFRFYDVPTGGNPLFEEIHASVNAVGGLLKVLIGSATDGGVPDTVLERPHVYLGVSVGEGDELTPRARVDAPPHGIKTGSAERLVKPGTLNPVVTVDAAGRVGVGTTAPQERLHVVGNILATGSITPGSSRRLKEDIRRVSPEEALDVLRSLEPVAFRYKAEAGDEQHVGFIAEDVPELVAAANRQGVDAMDIAAILTRVVQSQRAIIERHEARFESQSELIEMLAVQVERQNKEIDRLKARLQGRQTPLGAASGPGLARE